MWLFAARMYGLQEEVRASQGIIFCLSRKSFANIIDSWAD